jgi:hypothetical protein
MLPAQIEHAEIYLNRPDSPCVIKLATKMFWFTESHRKSVMGKSFRIVSGLLAFLTLIFSQAASQTVSQQNPTGTATITGLVKLGDAPAQGITLALIPDQGGRPGPSQRQGGQQQKILQATTDDKGQYQFANVAAGRFRVTLLTETLVPASSDPRAGGVVVTVTDGQVISQINFAMAPGGVVTGRVMDHQGRPVIAERINLMTMNATGQPRPFNGGNRFGYETDDRGVYRIYGLPAGKYIISAGTEGNRPGANRRIRYPRTYYPDATEAAQAQLVEVSSGSVAEGIDIRMGAPMKTYAVTGRAVDAETGEPVRADQCQQPAWRRASRKRRRACRWQQQQFDQ